MKKIKQLRDLETEKLRLRVRQLELEKEMRSSWLDLKESLRPQTFLKNKLADWGKETKQGDLFSSFISQGAAYVTRQVVDSAGDQLEEKVRHGVKTLTKKVRNIFRKKS